MTEHLIAVCKACGHTVRISVEHGGRRAKCPKCEGIIEIPKGEETSVRLRSDRELTTEARAKAGRGPDSEPAMPAPRLGRPGTSRIMKKAVHKEPGNKKVVMIGTAVATAAVLAGIIFIIMRNPGGETSSTPPAPPSTTKKTPPAPPAPPPPPPDPNAAQKDEIRTRLANFVKAFNTHDLNKMAPYYACDTNTLTKAFGKLPVDSEVTYEKVEVKAFDFTAPEVKTTVVLDRTVTDTETKKTEKQDGVERLLVWTQKEGKWVISSPPEP